MGLRAGSLTADDLKAPLQAVRRRFLASFERLYLVAQLRRYRGSTSEIARHAGLSEKHVRALLKRHGIDRREFRRPHKTQRPTGDES